jgi:hypothetical protein
VKVQLHAMAALPPGKYSWYELDRRLGEPQSRSGRCGVVKPPAPDLYVVQPVTIPTELCRLDNNSQIDV